MKTANQLQLVSDTAGNDPCQMVQGNAAITCCLLPTVHMMA